MTSPNGQRHPDSSERLRVEIETVSAHPVLEGVLQASAGLVAVLNDRREVLSVNHAFLEALGIRNAQELLGLRPGEVLHCVHHADTPTGCGTTPWCASCGLALSIVASLAGEEHTDRKCALSASVDGKPIDRCFAVRSHVFHIAGSRFILLFLQDITDEERRAALERIFLHDLNNIVMGLYSSSELLQMEDCPDQPAIAKMIGDLTLRLRTEIAVQDSLMRGSADPEFRPRLAEVSAAEILDHLRKVALNHRAAAGRSLSFPPETPSITFQTNVPLMVRALLNMTINALEASAEGGEVRISVGVSPDTVQFSVWNAGTIPPAVARRVFQQFFSTKAGNGRGFGTFGTRLIAEKYLGGTVGFTSVPEAGTTFQISLPR